MQAVHYQRTVHAMMSLTMYVDVSSTVEQIWGEKMSETEFHSTSEMIQIYPIREQEKQ